MHPGILVASCIALAGSAGFGANELTHGGMSEAMGLGHHHMMADFSDHCQGMHGGMAAMHGNGTEARTACASMNQTMMGG